MQIGVTLATLVSGAYGPATLAGAAERLADRARAWARRGSPLAFAVVTVCITFVTLVLGELAPKRIALQRADADRAARRADRST